MFININCINFHKRANDELVDDVIIPTNINKERVIINIENKKDIEYFIFVDYMKQKLESLKKNLSSWLNLIFGNNQRSNQNIKKKGIFFRPESYIDDIDQEKYVKCTKDFVIMKSVEFGLIPLQTIFDKKILELFENRKYIYDEYKHKKEVKEEKLSNNIKNDNNLNENSINNDNEESKIYITKDDKITYDHFLYENSNIEFRIDVNDNHGKVKIYQNNYLINEIIDHSAKINSLYYNPRLNMFATISKDGLACIYILPGKLFSIIKHPKNLPFREIFLSSNPFPTIITFEEKNKIITSYSLSGIIINETKIKDDDKIIIEPIFNTYGGGNKDRIKVFYNDGHYEIYNLPFLDIFNEKKKEKKYSQ